MADKTWRAFAHPDRLFVYAGDTLAKAWPALHAGNQEPLPDEKHLAALLTAKPALARMPGRRGGAAGRLARVPSREFQAGA
jgi:hypothetical protein